MTVDVRGKKNLELGVKSKLLFFNYMLLDIGYYGNNLVLNSKYVIGYYGNKYFLRKCRFTKYFGGFK